MTAKVTELDDSHDAGLRALLVAEGNPHDALSLNDVRYRPYDKLCLALADADVVGFLEGTFSESGSASARHHHAARQPAPKTVR